MDSATLGEEAEHELLNTWLWDEELDILMRECEEEEERRRFLEEEREWDECAGAASEYDSGSDDDSCADADEWEVFWEHGHEFRYEDGNPYYAADREERWENQILGQIKFPVPNVDHSCLSSHISEGSLHVQGPFSSDPNTHHRLLPQLPMWESRWVNRNAKEPCRRAIQVCSLNLSSPSDVPMEIYGTFAFRDVRNSQLRNCVFEYSRENPCKLKPGGYKLHPLITPPQGIYAVGLMLIEYCLLIKGQEKDEDKVLIDGYSIYAPSFYGDLKRVHWHINTGHSGIVDLRMVSIPKAVLVRLEFEVFDLGDNKYDSLTIAATYDMFLGSIIIFNGKLSVGKLPPLTLCLHIDRQLNIHVFTHCHPDGAVNVDRTPGCISYDAEDFESEDMSFDPKKDGSSTQSFCYLDGLQMDVTAIWSTFI